LDVESSQEALVNKNVIMGGIAAIALGVAIWLIVGGSGANNEDPAESMSQMQVWVCRSCKADIRMTKRQWMDLAMAGNFKCPQCAGAELADAIACPLCDKALMTLGHGRLPTTCIHCNGTLGNWMDQGEAPSESGARQPSGPPPG
jgi:Zn-finger nucleic acid-binding protein